MRRNNLHATIQQNMQMIIYQEQRSYEEYIVLFVNEYAIVAQRNTIFVL